MKEFLMLTGIAMLGAAAVRSRRPVPRTTMDSLRAAMPPAHVGQEGFEWPLAERFEFPADFRKALRGLGYAPPADETFVTEEMLSSVRGFQNDWWVVNSAQEKRMPITPSGYIDADTVHALAEALDMQREESRYWFDIVSDALNRLRPEVL